MGADAGNAQRRAVATSTRPSFLWGEHDPFSAAELAQEIAARLPDAQLKLMADAGHAVWIDEPDHTTTVVARLLDPSDRAEQPLVQAPVRQEV